MAQHDQPSQLKSWRVSIITCSDRAKQNVYADLSTPSAEKKLHAMGFTVVKSYLIADEQINLIENLNLALAEADVVVISGGTGLGPRDITPQTLDKFSDYNVPGFGELLRKESLKYSLNAYLSRCGAWVKAQKLILALPGNPKAVSEQLEILQDILPAALIALKGECKSRRPPE